MEKSKELTFPPRLEILQSAQDFHFSNPAATTIIIFSGFARRINAWVNGHNRRCLSLRGNENPLEFDPLYRTATCGLHYGQELGSTNRPDTFEQTKPSPMKILLAIRRRTIHFPHPRLRRVKSITRCATLTISPVQKIGQTMSGLCIEDVEPTRRKTF